MLCAGLSGSLTVGSLSLCGSAASARMTMHTSCDSDDEDTSRHCGTSEVQEVFKELLEIFDEAARNVQPQQRALNNLCRFYAANADELEACVPELEGLLCNRQVSATSQNPFPRASTMPSQTANQKRGRSSSKSSGAVAAVTSCMQRRSRSMS